MPKHICKYCGKQYNTGVQLGGHVGWCKQHPSYQRFIKQASKYNSGRIITQQTRLKISNNMKQRFKTNPKVKPFGGTRGKMSSYQYWFLQKVVYAHELQQKYDIVNQYYEYPYFLDFAFLNARLDVQIDGQFHDCAELLELDDIRANKIRSRGWQVYNISYKDIKYNEIDTITKFIQHLKEIETVHAKQFGNTVVLYRDYKGKKKRTFGQYVDDIRSSRTERQLDNIKKVLDSNIDYSKRGWSLLISDLIGIPRTKVSDWCKRFIPEYYITTIKRM